MKRIKQLDTILANQIAAGEVIERPASVIKECLENSLDAGATQIEIQIEQGGAQLIRIRDNGHGIEAEDLVLAFSRHATSKIQTLSDLSEIYSLGFRGEALASIASIARCRCVSRTVENDVASQILLSPDQTPVITVAAHPVGTTIEIESLFYNTPARRKFLKSEKTEVQAIEEVIKRLALSHPAVSFSLKNGTKVARQYNASSEGARIAQICGTRFMETAHPIALEAVGLSIKGYIGDPSLNKRHADCQYFFINQRVIRDRQLNQMIKLCFESKGISMDGIFPSYVLYLTVDPSNVDVNVHPTKQEVRFSEARLIYDFIRKAMEQAYVPEISASPIADHLDTKPKTFRHHEHLTHDILYAPVKESLIAKRYYVFETREGITVMDLTVIYREVLHQIFSDPDLIQSKPLLFPIRISCETLKAPEASTITLLETLGCQVYYADHALHYLSVPKCLEALPLDQFFSAFSQTIAWQAPDRDLCIRALIDAIPEQSILYHLYDSLAQHVERLFRASYPLAKIEFSHQALQHYLADRPLKIERH